MSLQLAKAAALDCMAAVRSGTDPLAAPPSPEMSFKQLSDDYTKAHKDRHSTKWTKEVERVLASDIMPALNGQSRTAAITRHDVSKVVERVSTRRAYSSANLALKIIRTLFRWGVSTGRCETDPTMGIKKFPSKARERVLSDAEIRMVWNAHSAFRDAFRLQLLLGMRIGEVLLATKDEIDLDQRVWTVPAGQDEIQTRTHVAAVPLAVDMLRVVLERAGASQWLFPSRVGWQAAAHRARPPRASCGSIEPWASSSLFPVR